MQLYEQVTGASGQNLARLAKNLDLSPDKTAAVVRAVLPEISFNLERKTLSRGGLADVIQSLGAPPTQDYLEPGTDLTSATAIEEGNRLLGKILQTKYQSRALADRAQHQTGVPAAKIRQMLPRIANVSMSALAEQTRPGLEEIFKKLPGFPSGPAKSPSTAPSSGSPLPLPGDSWGGKNRNGYDDLSDVLTRRQGPLQSNPLWDIARQVIGSVLGFQGKGILGYIIRFIVYRYGWSIVRMLLGRFVRV